MITIQNGQYDNKNYLNPSVRALVPEGTPSPSMRRYLPDVSIHPGVVNSILSHPHQEYNHLEIGQEVPAVVFESSTTKNKFIMNQFRTPHSLRKTYLFIHHIRFKDPLSNMPPFLKSQPSIFGTPTTSLLTSAQFGNDLANIREFAPVDSCWIVPMEVRLDRPQPLQVRCVNFPGGTKI